MTGASVMQPEDIYKIFKEQWSIKQEGDIKLPMIPSRALKNLCQRSIELLKDQAVYLELGYPLTIVGDIHGNIHDLYKIMYYFKPPPESNYLFLGDYVDRGDNSLAVIVSLLAMFCVYPVQVTLLRGNHEFEHINRSYGFYDEIMKLYNDKTIYDAFNEVFTYLPLVAVVNDEIFCVHGGLSPRMKSLVQIQVLEFPLINYEKSPIIADLVWSDPNEKIDTYERNFRGSGYIFGAGAVKEFLRTNHLKLIVRAHQCAMKGVHSFANDMGVTVFSCSDYGGIMKNRCGVMKVGIDQRLYFYSLSNEPNSRLRAKAIMTLQEKGFGMIFPKPVDKPKEIPSDRHRHAKPTSPNGLYRSMTSPGFTDTHTTDIFGLDQAEQMLDAPHDSIKFLREDVLIRRKTKTIDGFDQHHEVPQNPDDLMVDSATHANTIDDAEIELHQKNLKRIPKPERKSNADKKPRKSKARRSNLGQMRSASSINFKSDMPEVVAVQMSVESGAQIGSKLINSASSLNLSPSKKKKKSFKKEKSSNGSEKSSKAKRKFKPKQKKSLTRSTTAPLLEINDSEIPDSSPVIIPPMNSMQFDMGPSLLVPSDAL